MATLKLSRKIDAVRLALVPENQALWTGIRFGIARAQRMDRHDERLETGSRRKGYIVIGRLAYGVEKKA